MDLASKFTLSASMLLTGFTIVFGVLLLLIFIIWAYGKIITAVMKKSNEKKAAKASQEAKKAQTAPAKQEQAKPTPSAPVASNGINDEVVAAISAAVYSMYGSTDKVKIKSIKKACGRSAWANAGVINNTRPF